jgi:hypothetical protein
MNFDDLKSAWEKDQSENIETPVNIKRLSTAQMPIDQLRGKMKGEFWLHCFSLLIAGLYPQIFHFNKVYYFPFYTLFMVYMAICIYYLAKFYLFYKRLSPGGLPTKDSLYETYYDIRLYIEMYKTYSYSLVPFALVFIGAMVSSINDGKLLISILKNGLSDRLIIVIVATFVISVILVMVITEIWARKRYGSYAIKIRQLLDELKED